jgi:outer membrane protein assembly factor BamA
LGGSRTPDHSLRLTLNWDQRDNGLFPTCGNYQSAPSSLARVAGASFSSCASRLHPWYFSLFWGIVFKAKG